MATVKRAKGWFLYVAALMISGFFSFLGKSSPTWAEEVKSTHSAKVFNEQFRVAENTKEIQNLNRECSPIMPAAGTRDCSPIMPAPGGLRDCSPIMPAPGGLRECSPIMPSPGENFGNLDKVTRDNVTLKLNANIIEINKKLAEGRDLDAGELALIQSNQNAEALNLIYNQLNVILLKLK